MENSQTEQPVVHTGLAIVATEPAPPPPETQTHFFAFFAGFANFEYDPTKPIVSEFKRLQATPEWKRGINRRVTTQGFKLSLVLQFNATYGTDQNDLASWQNLCRALALDIVPDKVSACKKIVKSTHVNLVDLVDMPNTNQPVKLFESVGLLANYSKRHKKIFPRNEAKAGGILKYLLRQIV